MLPSSLVPVVRSRFPEIIRGGRTCEIELLPKGPALRGFFTLELIDAKSKLIKQVLRFENLITDAGLNAINGTTLRVVDMTTYFGVGTGSTAPDVAQTDLITPAAVSPRSNTTVSGFADESGFDAVGFAWWRRTRSFSESQGNGNLAEVGAFSAASAGTMFSRQLIKDALGVPTTLVKTSADILRITYEVRLYPPADLDTTIDISGTSYDIRVRAQSQSSGSNTWAALVQILGTSNLYTATPPAGVESNAQAAVSTFPSTGTSSSFSSATQAAYTGGTFYRDLTYIAEPGSSNFTTGIGTIVPWLSTQGRQWAIYFTSTKVPKLNTQRLTLNFRHSYTRH